MHANFAVSQHLFVFIITFFLEELKRNETRGGKGVEINFLGEIRIC